jgi:hypothetical protein
MIALGIILLVVGFLTGISILWTLGIILAVLGAVFWVLGSMGHAVRQGKPVWQGKREGLLSRTASAAGTAEGENPWCPGRRPGRQGLVAGGPGRSQKRAARTRSWCRSRHPR